MVALQSIDTLKTVTCDQDLLPRIVELGLVPQLVQMMNHSISGISDSNHEYLEFVQDFISTYAAVLNEQVGILAQSVIQRIQVEQSRTNADNEHFKQKCINLLVHITQNKLLMSKYAADFERLYMPIFEFMVDPTQISFEDNILLMIKNFIKKTGQVSDIILKVMPTLEKVFQKNKNTFGDSALLETINCYLIHG